MKDYQPPSSDVWVGRTDDERARFFQIIECCSLEQPQRPFKDALVLLGFCSDEGIERNQGRKGAALGPHAFRSALSGMACHSSLKSFYDVGDVIVEQGLEHAQNQLGFLLNDLYESGAFPVVIGGGHETAYGHYLGFEKQGFARNLAIVNFDAHFDLRQEHLSTSGTPFWQIYQRAAQQGYPFSYYCFGIQEQANSKKLFQTAKELGVHYRTHLELFQNPKLLHTELDALLAKHDAVYLSVCLDVFSSAYAPGVSAASPLGLMPNHVLDAVNRLAQSKKVKAFDIVELSPPWDINNQTSKLAASILAGFITNQWPVK